MAVYTTGGGVAPKRVQFVEYIQSSGTQYIDTGVKPTGNTRVVADVEWTPEVAGKWLFGCRNAQNEKTYNLLSYDNKYRSDYNVGSTSAYTSNSPKGRFLLDKDKGITKINGSIVNTQTNKVFQAEYNLFLFANNQAGKASGNCSAKIFSFKIYDNGQLVRDFLPAVDDTGDACLYETISNNFYKNKGTGKLIAGGVV